MRYLGVSITISKLGELACRTLVDKIMGKIRQWSRRSISFVGRANLFNSVIFGMYNFWASIFILPQEVIDYMNQLCRNYFWWGLQSSKDPHLFHGVQSAHLKNMGG